MYNIKKTTRGTVWWVDLPVVEGSCVEQGRRPCLVVSRTDRNEHSGVVTVCPLTTKLDTVPNHPKINCRGKVAQVLCEQLVTLDISSLGDFVWNMKNEDMYIVNRELRGILDLDSHSRGRQSSGGYNNNRW